MLAWAGFTPRRPRPASAGPQKQPPHACYLPCPSGAFSAAGLTTVLGRHPVSEGNPETPSPPTECSSSVPDVAEAQAP